MDTSAYHNFPFAFSFGACSELRHPLCLTMAWGLFFSQVITLLITSVIHLSLTVIREADCSKL